MSVSSNQICLFNIQNQSNYKTDDLTHSLPMHPFSTPLSLKTSQNRKVFWCFPGVEKKCIGNEWVNVT